MLAEIANGSIWHVEWTNKIRKSECPSTNFANKKHTHTKKENEKINTLPLGMPVNILIIIILLSAMSCDRIIGEIRSICSHIANTMIYSIRFMRSPLLILYAETCNVSWGYINIHTRYNGMKRSFILLKKKYSKDWLHICRMFLAICG